MGASVTPSIGAKIKAGVERLNNPFVRKQLSTLSLNDHVTYGNACFTPRTFSFGDWVFVSGFDLNWV
jgi:hypothetical protein